MPELPEVELARRSLVRWFDGRTVVRTESDDTRIFRGADRNAFAAIKGRLTQAERRGKYLLLGFGEDGLMAHLGMTGKFVRRTHPGTESFSRARFFLDSGDIIHFKDPRMFGQIFPHPHKQLLELTAVAKLGIDPLVDGLDWNALKGALGASKQQLKVALMDQERVTGLGNIHAAEALFRSKLHPGRLPKSLSDDEWKALTKGIHAAFKFALEAQEGEEIEYVEEPGAENPFLIYGRAGTPCRTCKTKVKSFTQGGRTTHFCPTCQPKSPPRKKKK